MDDRSTINKIMFLKVHSILDKIQEIAENYF